MATPLSADRLVKALRDEGLKVVEVRSWRTHNRNHKGAWGPVYGSIVHHTVTSGTSATVNLCYDGHSALPGPLCHGVIAKDGTIYLVGNGRANHAGGGDPAVLAKVRDESYNASQVLVPTKGNSNGTDGNYAFYGWECENRGDGKDPWPAEQYDAIVRAQAAICRAHGWTAKSVIAHKEWSNDKVDPRGISIIDVRQDVAERLSHVASWSPGEEDDVALSEDDKKWLVATIKAETGRAVAAWKNADIDSRDNYQVWRDAANNARSAADGIKGLSTTGMTPEQMDNLAELVADKLAARLVD